MPKGSSHTKTSTQGRTRRRSVAAVACADITKGNYREELLLWRAPSDFAKRCRVCIALHLVIWEGQPL